MIVFDHIEPLEPHCYAGVQGRRDADFRCCLRNVKVRLIAASGNQFLVCGPHGRIALEWGQWFWIVERGFDFFGPTELRILSQDEMARLEP